MLVTIPAPTAFGGQPAPTGGATAGVGPFVFVANINSPDISRYDASNGVLTALPPPTSGPGGDQQWIAITPDGTTAYVTVPEPATVRQYAIGADGTLTLRSSTPAPDRSLPAQVEVSPDGRSVYVLFRGGAGGLLQYTVEADGSLTPKTPVAVAAGDGPSALAVSPDSRSVYVTNTVTGLSTVYQFTAAADGTLTPKDPAALVVGDGPFSQVVGVTVSPDGRSVYVADAVATVGSPGRLLQFTVAADGSLSAESPAFAPAGNFPRGVVVSPDGGSVYVTADQTDDGTGPGVVLQFSVAADGTLTPKAPPSVPAGDSPYAIAISPDGSSVYAANLGGGISQYAVGPGGNLSPRSPATVSAGIAGRDIVVTPSPSSAPMPETKDDCKKGGWARYGFDNQGQCIAYVVRGPKA